MNTIVNIYLSVSNHFGKLHANWFDFTLMVVGWCIVCAFCLWACNRKVTS